jgi:hypothetical protein
MRNAAYFLAAFSTVGLLILLTGCSMEPRKPHAYEQRQAQKRTQDADEARIAAKKRESAVWWNCTRDNGGARGDC